jgi:uncharacterized membrane protein
MPLDTNIQLFFKRLFRMPLSPQRFFLLIGGTLSIALVFITPPFQAPDEATHFYKEVYLSHGHLIAKVLPAPHRVGDYLPAKYAQTASNYTYMALNPSQKMHSTILHKDLSHPLSDNTPTLTDFENTAQYAPLAYLPQALSIFIARIFTGSVLLQMYAARLATAVCWTLLAFLAIRFLPFAHWGAVALSMTPLALFLSSSCSNDAITFGICFLFISLVLRAIVSKKRLSRNLKLGIILSGLGLGLCKPPYLLLILLAAAIPSRKFVTKRQYGVFLTKLFTGTLLLSLVWVLLAHKITLNFYPGSDSIGQVNFIFHHPLSTLKMLLLTMFISPYGNDMLVQVIGLKAWVSAITPLWIIGLSYLLILIGTLYIPRGRRPTLSSPPLRWLSVLIFVSGIFAVWLLLYITYTPVGLNTVVGLNGRYFVPFFYLIIPLLGSTSLISVTLEKRSLKLMKFGILLVAVSVLPSVISRYYFNYTL